MRSRLQIKLALQTGPGVTRQDLPWLRMSKMAIKSAEFFVCFYT